MSSTNRNFIFAYAFLVVLPLMGLAGILKSGSRLAAPAAIDGLWSVQLDSPAVAFSPCGVVANSILPKSISISQSGRSFVLAVPGNPQIAAYGTIDGNSLHAFWAASEARPISGSVDAHNCSARAFALLARVEDAQNPTVLTGSVSATDCPTCAPVGFHAERQSGAASKEGR